MFYCTPKGTLTALPVIHASFLAVPHTWEKLGKTLKKNCKNLGKPKNLGKNLQKPKKPWKNLQKPWKTKKMEKTKKQSIYIYIYTYIFLGSLGGSLPRLSENCFSVFFGGVFQGFFYLFGFSRFLQVFPMFFWFWSLSAICTFLYTGRSVFSCVQACRNQSFNHCSYEHTGSEDQDCAFQFWNVRPCPR